MADINQTDVQLNVNNQEAKRSLDEVKKKLAELEAAWVKTATTGDKQMRDKLNKQIQATKRELRQMESGAKACERVFLQMNKATPNDLRKALNHLQSELKNIERGTPAWDAHVAKIRRVKAELDKINAEMRQSESLLVRMKNKVNDWGAMAMGAIGAMTGVVMAGKKAVTMYAEMQQEEANVRKYTGMTEEEVTHLNEAFKKMDTRTSREELNKLAQEAGRLGLQSEEDVLGFVKAADKINVALDDLGEGATLTLSKLTDIFGDKQRLGVEKSLLAVGSVINELSQNSTASAPYLAEFAQRLAGVGAQAQMSIPEIMGFGAVLDSQGQKLEMSATALSKVIMNLFKDPAKIASATGLAVEEFSETCKRSTNEGLLMLLDRLHELGGIDALAPVFKDMGENGARASAVLAALAGNVDMVRQQQEAANDAFREATSIDKEFEVQNTTVQAGLEKARKGFTEMAVTLGKELMPIVSKLISGTSMTMRVMLKVIQFVKEYRGYLIALTATLVTYYTIMKAQDAWNAFIGGCKKAIEAVKAFNKALISNPYAAVAAAVVGLVIAIGSLIKRSSEARKAEEEHRKALERQREAAERQVEADKRVASSIGELIAKYKLLQGEWSRLSSMQEKREWVEKNKESFAELGLKIGDVVDADNAFINNTEAYVSAVKARAKANAIQELYEDEYKKQMENASERARAKADEYGVNIYRDGIEQAHVLMEAAGITKDELGTRETRDGRYTTYTRGVKEGGSGDRKLFQYFLDEVTQEALSIAEEKYGSILSDALAAVEPETNGGNSTGSTRQFSGKDAVDEWKKKQEAIQKAKLAQGEIDSEQYNRKMLELERDYQANLMTVLGEGSSDYIAANAARLAAVKKLEEQDITDRFKSLKVAEQTKYYLGLTSHKEYTRKMLELDMEEKEARLNIQTEGTADYLAAQAAYLEAKKKLKQEETKVMLEEEKKGYEDTKAIIRQSYAEGKLTNRAYHLALEKAELDHLQAVVNAYEEGSEERLKAEREYARKSLEIQNKHKEDAKKIREDLTKSYFSKVAGNTDPGGMEEEKMQLEAVRMELLAAAQTAEQKLEIEEAYQKARYEIAKKYNDEAEMMAVNSAQASVDKVLDYMKTDGFQGFYQSFQTLVSGMGEIFSGLSDLIDAEVTLQEQKINKKYEAELKAAEGNAAETERIEAEKEKEIAKVKNEAEEKKYGMQIASAIAQTAISAINAYSSAAAIPVIGWIMGPIAAAMAVAAGGIQIATLKKQHEAAMAQGYAAGGYTMPGSKYQPAGIVHAGEWVASQELLANPTAAATIAQLDQAQRTNTIGQLSKPGPSASVSSSERISSPTEAHQPSNGSASVSESLERLNRTLDNGIYAATTMTGDKGIVRAQRRYEQLMRNKSKK